MDIGWNYDDLWMELMDDDYDSNEQQLHRW
jgi:hypothetical protein